MVWTRGLKMKKRIVTMLIIFTLAISVTGCRLPFADNKKCNAVQELMDQLVTACEEEDYDKASALFVNEEDRKAIGSKKESDELKRKFKKNYGEAAIKYAEAYSKATKVLLDDAKTEVVYVNRNNQAVVRFEMVNGNDFIDAFTELAQNIGSTYQTSNAKAAYSMLIQCIEQAKSEINPNNRCVFVVPVKVEEIDGQYKIAELNQKLKEQMKAYGLGLEEEIIQEIMENLH